jgi:hypothetical protein
MDRYRLECIGTEAHHERGHQKENRGCADGTVGEAEAS